MFRAELDEGDANTFAIRAAREQVRPALVVAIPAPALALAAETWAPDAFPLETGGVLMVSRLRHRGSNGGDFGRRTGTEGDPPDALLAPRLSTSALEHVRERLLGRHLGTLGGGNHFVELDRDMSGQVWLLVHSGSRGLGSAIGAHHLKVAEASGLGDVPGLRVDAESGQAFVGCERRLQIVGI